MRRLAVGMAIFSIAVVAVSWAVADDRDIAREITAKLKQEQEEGNLWGFDINLQVGQGTVTLKGHVSSLEQQQLALDVARQADGVKKVVDQLQILQTTEPADDDSIAAAVADKLAEFKAAGQMKDFRIGVNVTEGAACLNGSVASQEQKQLALEAAGKTPGVNRVVDQLTITPVVASSEGAGAATVIEVASQINDGPSSAARETLCERPAVPQLEPQAIQVVGAEPQRAKVGRTSQSHVPATVATPSPADLPELNRAVNKATVTPVENAIYQHEAKDKPLTDQEIGDQLMAQLQEAKQGGQLRGFGIGVHVQEGQVRLTGRVSSREQLQLALDVARRIKGVREVVNELTIGEPGTVARPADSRNVEALSLEIAQSLGNRLQELEQRGTLAGCDFDVKVEQAKVRLVGAVASAEQERLVLQVARQVPGVQSVEGDLRIAAGRPAPIAAMPVSVNGPSYPINDMSASGFVPYQGQSTEGLMVDQTPRPLGPGRAVARASAAIVAAPFVAMHQLGSGGMGGDMYGGGGAPAQLPGAGQAVVPARYDHPNLPGYAWPSYAAHPNYAAVTYPKQYSPTAWPYIGPFYPYPQVPLGWRKVTLKWDDGWWQLNFKSK